MLARPTCAGGAGPGDDDPADASSAGAGVSAAAGSEPTTTAAAARATSLTRPSAADFGLSEADVRAAEASEASAWQPRGLSTLKVRPLPRGARRGARIATVETQCHA